MRLDETRPAPHSLRKLELRTSAAGYDLTRHYVDWRTDNLHDVRLDQKTSVLPQLQQFVGAPTEPHILIEYGLGRACIFARGPGAGHSRSVTFLDDEEDAACVASMLLDAEPDLRGVRCVQVPIYTLASLLRVLAVLPELRCLSVFFKAYSDRMHTPASHHLPWAMLSNLVPAQNLCPALEEIDLEVVCWNEDCPLTSDDARELSSQLAVLGDHGLHDVCIKGFPEEIVRDVDASHVDAFGVYFGDS
ncbi:hypothetical protein AURDEDRAFT_171218 [Auricularia subglabra TFB-10046 SS5]|uniref:Uncharacterized protein n=1 Tax=Auricularia subglabra (strain TFB-10046 / SS5) TaxID=717982 RepID=J0DCD6_AURST|nr:hypothetical protein AURDEDRAFT_171218 [Auricularia subglabra TFB-10046 SS5]